MRSRGVREGPCLRPPILSKSRDFTKTRSEPLFVARVSDSSRSRIFQNRGCSEILEPGPAVLNLARPEISRVGYLSNLQC